MAKKIGIKSLIIAISFIAIISFGNKISFASTNCQPIYGGGQTCTSSNNIQITKQVQNPQTGVYVNNLGVNDPKYAPGQYVNFQITVANTGSSLFSKVRSENKEQLQLFIS